MNAKKLRQYGLIIELSKTAAGDAKLPMLLAELCTVDFVSAFEMWEYMLAQYQSQLNDASICANIEDKPFGMFMRISETKARQMLCDSQPLQKLVYGTTATAAAGNNLAFVVNLILSNKLDEADEMLRCLKNNPNIDFNEKMRVVIDNLFATYCTRNAVKVPVFNKKQVKMLTSHIEKVRGPNKALLTQRLKEL